MTPRLPVAAALAVLALAGCARSTLPPIDNPTPVESACRSSATAAPEVVSLRAKFSQSPWTEAALRDDERAAELRAYRDCLRAHGVRDSGGVEVERRPTSLQIF